MSLVDFIIKSESYDLTGDDIRSLCDNKVKVLSYHELANVNNLNDLLNGAVILLYETKQNFGHWTALIKQQNFIEFFDSYGLQMDQELNYATYDNTPYLTNLVNKSNYRVISNNTKYQALLKDVNTCGRWTAMRVVFRDYNIGKFKQMFLSNNFSTPDFWVSCLTFLNIAKKNQLY